jgi:hypothetical protein
MAWSVAVVVDPKYHEDAIDQLARYHPIWIIDTPSNRTCAQVARQAAGEMWTPEAACTTFCATDVQDREQNCLDVVDMIDLHHPHLAKINLIGVPSSRSLTAGMKELGFIPATSTWDDSVAFRKPISSLTDVPTFRLDASLWKQCDDVYTSLFKVLGSPAWHGKNFNALNDSIVTGGINTIEVPYKILICEAKKASFEVRQFLSALADFLSAREAEGCPVSIQIEN